MTLALYRKYRPRKLSDVVGQETNVEILKNAARKNRLGQAYLFYGPRGTGKTTTARLIAKLLNCERRHDDPAFRERGEPCNDCRSCNAIDANASFDVVEIDAASNRGIDEIRNLKEHVRTAPAEGRYKVYIVDEAHMLTTPAANALLKTLEEPPQHAIFILATTEYEKLPPTITSRTQRFLFKKLPKTKILEKLRMIAKAEEVKIDDAALELVAAAAEGSVRDAESLLDQIASCAAPIDLPTAERLTGRTGLKKVHEFAELVAHKNLRASLAYAMTLQEEGVNLTQFTRDLIHYLRKALAVRVNPGLEDMLHAELTADEVERLKQLASGTSEAALVPLLKSFIRAYGEMRYSPFAMIPLEIALIENLSS